MIFDLSRVRHPKESLYGPVTLALGMVGWLAILLMQVISATHGLSHVFVFVFYVLVGWFFSYVVHALTRAYMIGHYVLIGPDQFPHLHEMVVDGAKTLGVSPVPQAFIYNANGVMNAMAVRLVGRARYVWLTSALIDADNDQQIKFIIGHELGHHIAGHLDRPKLLLRAPALLIPFLGLAYSRSRELTCDRIGLFVAKNIDASRTALQMLASGSAKLNVHMNADAFQRQEQMMPSIAGFILYVFSSYPRLTRRVDEIAKWYDTV